MVNRKTINALSLGGPLLKRTCLERAVHGSSEASQDEATAPNRAPFAAGEPVLLVELTTQVGTPTRKQLVATGQGTQKVPDVGIVDTDKLVGLEPGATYALGRHSYLLCRPTARDLMETVRRKAQIVLPKDAAQIILQAGIAPGARIVEAGIGSGALTMALATAVGPTGRVHNYELREDFQRWARGNLERAGLIDRVSLHLGNAENGIQETDLDAVVFDLPEPWKLVDDARRVLLPGGSFTAYTPSVSQMEQTVRALREAGYLEVRTQETLVRGWHVGDKGVRPDFEMLGHTAWLTFARSPGPKA